MIKSPGLSKILRLKLTSARSQAAETAISHLPAKNVSGHSIFIVMPALKNAQMAIMKVMLTENVLHAQNQTAEDVMQARSVLNASGILSFLRMSVMIHALLVTSTTAMTRSNVKDVLLPARHVMQMVIAVLQE